jgi:hypothetical protein
MQLGGFGNSVDGVLQVDIPPGAQTGCLAVVHVVVDNPEGVFTEPVDWDMEQEAVKGNKWSGVYYYKVGDTRSWTVEVDDPTGYTICVMDGIPDPGDIEGLAGDTGSGNDGACDIIATTDPNTTCVLLALQDTTGGAVAINMRSDVYPAAVNLQTAQYCGTFYQRLAGDTPVVPCGFYPLGEVSDWYTWTLACQAPE